MALTAFYHCPLCPRFAAESFNPVLRHIGSFHSFEPGFQITCGLEGCQSNFGKFSSYKSHLYRKHRELMDSCLERPTNSGNVENDEPLCPDDAMEIDHERWCNRDLLQASGAKFILRMKEGLCLSQQACDEMVSGVTELFSGIAADLHQSVRSICETAGEAGNLVHDVDGMFHDESKVNPFLGLSSQYYQHKYFREKFDLLEPTERKLGQRVVRKYQSGSSKLVPCGDYCYDVDLLKSIEALLQIDSVMEQIENPHYCHGNLMADMCDGEAFKTHPLYTVDPQALQVILYYDDLEICNPLGASVKTHKLGAFYYTLGNLRPRNRSLLHTIQLVALAKTSVIQQYGIDVILEPFMSSICQLEKGHSFMVNGNRKNMNGTLLLVSADNLASHFIGGYKALSAALRKCRYCLATNPDMSTKFTAESFVSRTQAAHKRYIEALTGPNPSHISTTYGVVRDSILNRSAYFHVVDGLAPDVLHDVLEGLLQYEVKLLLHNLICEEHLFTLNQLNQRLQSFDYGYHLSKNKPSTISDSRLRSRESNLLGQSATKMWCLGRILPLVIGEWVPEDQPQYRTFLLLRTILDITMAPVTSPEKVMYLREIIDEHHQLFRQSYPTSSVTPKMHYITHLPQWMMRYGPVVRFWTMRFEGRHRLFKRLSSVMCNFINIPKSLAHRYQEYQCYNLLNKENYFREETTFGKTKTKSVQDLDYKDSLIAKVPALTEDHFIGITATAEVLGTVYKAQCCVLIGRHLDLPQFGQVQDIVVENLQVYLVVEVLSTCYFHDHYYSYEVVRTPNPQIAIFLPSELKDFQALHMRQVKLEMRTVKLITVKYDIDL